MHDLPLTKQICPDEFAIGYGNRRMGTCCSILGFFLTENIQKKKEEGNDFTTIIRLSLCDDDSFDEEKLLE